MWNKIKKFFVKLRYKMGERTTLNIAYFCIFGSIGILVFGTVIYNLYYLILGGVLIILHFMLISTGVWSNNFPEYKAKYKERMGEEGAYLNWHR